MISIWLSTGSCLGLEGTAAIPVYVGSQAGLLDRLRQQIHRSAKKLRKAPLQSPESEHPDASTRVQFGREIDVAINLRIATSN